jgi:hypothetical protein
VSPIVALLDVVAAGGAEFALLFPVIQQCEDGFGKLGRLVGDQQILTGLGLQGRDRLGGGDDRRPTGHGFENLVLDAGAVLDGGYGDGGRPEIGTDVVDGAGDGNSWVSRKVLYLVGRVLPNDPKLDFRFAFPNQGQDLVDQNRYHGDIGMITHFAADYQGGVLSGNAALRGEISQVNAIGQDRNVRGWLIRRGQREKGTLVYLRGDEDPVKLTDQVAFVGSGTAELKAGQKPAYPFLAAGGGLVEEMGDAVDAVPDERNLEV